MAEDDGAFEVDTIADAASNGNTLVAMAAAVQVGIGWLRRGVILEEVTADEVLAAVDVRLLGSLPLRTWPLMLEESSLGLMLGAGGPSSHGQMESLAVEAVLKRA